VRLAWERLRGRRAALPTTSSGGTGRPPEPSPPDAPVRASPGSVEAATAAPTPAVSRAPPPSLRLPQRIVLHVYAQGRIARDDVAPLGLCQAGMSESLNEPQSHLSKPLARLVAGGVLTVDRRHVAGKSRRLLVYTLTPLGEALARDLRRSVTPGPAPFVPAWMGRP
jgi:DNA-binding MarR family transcriptional regulator